MAARGPRHLRATTNVVLSALLQAAEQGAHDRPLSIEALRGIVSGLETSSSFDPFFRRAWDEVVAIVESEKVEAQRTNAFGRLMIHPLGPLFEAGAFDRAILPNIFSFLHLVLGDDAELFGVTCREVVDDLKQTLGGDFCWDDFYEDPRAKPIQWRTLVRIAASFKRWDVRKDWFIKLMQYTPTSVSMGQSAFVVRDNADQDRLEPRVFTNREFCQFFHALFAPLVDISKADEMRFQREFGADTHHLIGQFLVNLTACSG